MTPKNALIIVLMSVLVVFAGVITGSARKSEAGVLSAMRSYFYPAATAAAPESAGNGLGGMHYRFSLVGVPKGNVTGTANNEGNVISVNLGTKTGSPVTTKIMLAQSTDGSFHITDGRGTDGTASLKLPSPGTYGIWVKPLGKLNGESKVSMCAIDPSTAEKLCSTSNEVFVRGTGKSTFRNVTNALTTIDLDSSLTDVIAACGASTVSLFDPCLEGYFWTHDNNGLRSIELRLYKAQ